MAAASAPVHCHVRSNWTNSTIYEQEEEEVVCAEACTHSKALDTSKGIQHVPRHAPDVHPLQG